MTIEGPTLEDRLEVLLASTEGIREQMRLENVKRDHRSRRMFATALIVAVLGVAAGVSGYVDAHHASRDLATANANTTVARRSSCLQQNDSTRQGIRAEQDEFRSHDEKLIRTVTHETALTASQLAALDVYYHGPDGHAGFNQRIANDHPRRDCTPPGIAAYLNQKGT